MSLSLFFCVLQAVAQYLEEGKPKRNGSPDLDPISASRSPNANVEPPYGTRYANHRFACKLVLYVYT